MILFFLFSGCNRDGQGITTVIRGEFPEFAGRTLTLSEIDINAAIPVDTTKIKPNGSFRFRLDRPGPGFYLLKIDNRNYITLVLDQESRVSVSAAGKDLRKSYTVEGSPDSDLYRGFEQFLEVNKQKVDSMGMIFNDAQRSPQFQSMKMEMDDRYQKIFDQQRKFVESFLQNNCQSLSSILVINRRFGQRKIFSEDADLEHFLRLDSCLSAKYPGNKHVLEQKEKLTRFIEKRKLHEYAEAKLAPGNTAPDLSLETPEGKVINLHSLKGQPVIVYFWASWDDQSRQANAVLKESLGRTGTKKARVYAVGLESYREVWKNAIQIDGTGQWIHVTDYLNIYSASRNLFNVPEKLPYYYLLDAHMVIVDKGHDLSQLSVSLDKL